MSAHKQSSRWTRQDKPAKCPLTQREWEVMSGLAAGRSVDHIARICQITTSTVRSNIGKSCKRLGVHNRREAIVRVRQGWPRPTPAGRREPDTNPTMHAYTKAFDKLLANWRDGDLVDKQKRETAHLLAAERERRGVIVVPGEGRGTHKKIKDELPRSILPGL